MSAKAGAKIVCREPNAPISVDGDMLFDLVIGFRCRAVTDVIGNDVYFLRSPFEPLQLTFCQFTQAGQCYRKPRTVLRLQNFLTGIRPMIEISPLGVNSRAEQRNVGHLADDTLQSLAVACSITVLLSKGITAVHYEAKSLAVIGHVVIYQFDVVDFLISEFVKPLDGKFVDLLHICHYGTPPIFYKVDYALINRM